MNKEEQLNKFINLYDRFIDHYNEVKNKITATSELIIIHDELEKRMVNSRFVKITKEGKLKDYTPDDEMHYRIESIRESFIDIISKENFAEISNKISADIMNGTLGVYIENFSARGDKYGKLYEKSMDEKNLKEKIHLDAIHSVTEKIIINQYPKLLLKFNKLGSKEKEELRGAILEKVNIKEERQAEHWPNIVRAVHAVVGDKSLSQFVTKNGNAKVILYDNVFKKYDKVKKGTLRDWLNEALKSDKLGQDLLNMRNNKNIDGS